jgi:hypothetical protein
VREDTGGFRRDPIGVSLISVGQEDPDDAAQAGFSCNLVIGHALPLRNAPLDDLAVLDGRCQECAVRQELREQVLSAHAVTVRRTRRPRP